MESEMQIRLQKVRFFGYHGLDAGEEITGGEFEVSLVTNYIPAQIPLKNIEDTLDYTILLALVKEKMKKPVYLLETLATEIASEIIAKFSIVTEVVISISKLHPPIKNFEGIVGVTFKMKRN
jgi:dihydroneopterin aldolase